MRKLTKKLLSDITMADTLKTYLNSKVFDNFVAVFNQWAVSNKLGSMSQFSLTKNEKKIIQSKNKQIFLKKLKCREVDVVEKLIGREETSRLADSFMNASYFGGDVVKEERIFEQKRKESFFGGLEEESGMEGFMEESVCGDDGFEGVMGGGFANVSIDWGKED